MSYLGVPRLHFSGSFKANPSTINNDPRNFGPTALPIVDGGWNPNGNHDWQFENCKVQSVCYKDGTFNEAPATDPIVGASVLGDDGFPPIPKLVDLDRDNQGVSEIWGLRPLKVGGDELSLAGHFKAAAFAGMWERVPSAGFPFFSAFYQSILTDLAWEDEPSSRFLQELRSISPDKLSIKFIVDGYDLLSHTGRIVGTIGAAADGEPDHFVKERLLRPADATFFDAPFRIDLERKVLLLDLGNSIATSKPGGPPRTKLGTINLAVLPPNRPLVLLGKIDYSLNAYEKRAYVQEFPLSPDQLALVTVVPVAIVRSVVPGTKGSEMGMETLMKERDDGREVRADRFVHRLNPGDTATVSFYATEFGRPLANERIILFSRASTSDGTLTSIPPQTPIQTQPTDSGGRVQFEILVGDPGIQTGREFKDGQVYSVQYGLQDPPSINLSPTPLSIRVFTKHAPTGTPPTWRNDIEPIFAHYARMYPAMKQVLDISNYTTVKQNRDTIIDRLGLLREDPSHMPVSRDLSQSKLDMILAWFAAGMPET